MAWFELGSVTLEDLLEADGQSLERLINKALTATISDTLESDKDITKARHVVIDLEVLRNDDQVRIAWTVEAKVPKFMQTRENEPERIAEGQVSLFEDADTGEIMKA